MSRKLAAILWAAKVLFIFCFIISLPIVFWHTTDMKLLVNHAYKSMLAGGTWNFVTSNASSFFFFGFFFTLMFLILRHNQKRLRQDRVVGSETEEDNWLLEKPEFSTDPMNYNITGNIYHTSDMHEKQ